jgi:hypothetical protein
MNAGEPLDVSDISNLVKSDMPSALVVGYLNSTRRVYHLSPAQLGTLRAQGASPQILNYLQESGGFYGQGKPGGGLPVPRGQQRAAYENSPLYQDEQPFAYNEPVIDDWYDSAYEESLYSPFSYDN